MERYILRTDGEEITIDAEMISNIDIISIGENRYHIISEGMSFYVEMINEDQNDKTISLVLKGNRYDFKIDDQLDLLIGEMGYTTSKNQKFSELISPMPGMLLDIMVEEGQEIEEGQAMLVLEAMKMENILKAPGKGVVKKILLKKGDPVDKNQIIIKMA